MLKKLKYVFVILAIYLVFLVVLFPANFAVLYAKDEKLIPKDVGLHAVSGSVWNGRLNQVTYQHIALDNVRWTISPLSLLTGKLDVALIVGKRGSDIKADGNVSINGDLVSVSDFNIKAPIETLIKDQPLPYGLNASGQLHAKIEFFTQGKPWCTSLKAKLTANETVLKSPFGKLDVELFTANLTCPKGVLTVATQEKNNNLGINGTVLLTKSKEYTAQAKVKPPASAPTDYINLLKFSGKPNNQGEYSFKHSGRL